MSELKPVEIEAAIAQCQQQIASNPQTAQLYVQLGNLYARQQQWRQAIENYRQAVALKPNLIEAHRRLAAVLNQRGRRNEAANHLFEAFRFQPELASPKQHYELARDLQQQDKFSRAIASYRQAIELQPDFIAAYQALADLLQQQGKAEIAIETYRQGVKHNPRNPAYTFALASALAAEKKWHRACNNYQLTAELEQSARVYSSWGIACYELEEYAAAQSRFQQAAQLERSAETYYYWGLTHLKLQEETQAESKWQQAISLDPSYVPAQYQLGKLWQNQRQWQEAISVHQQVLSLDPGFAPAAIDLGMIHRHLKQFDLAITYLHQALDCVAKASPLEKLAFKVYQQTIAEHPQATAELYYQLAKLLRARGYFPEAIAACSRTIELDPYLQEAYIDLQYTPTAKKLFPDLVRVYRQIVTEHPEITVAWGNLGDALTQLNRVEEAIECYRTGSYQQTIKINPDLAQLNWPTQKTKGPDFIIAGASKSGTSSIYFYLSRHPQVFLSHKKEIDFYWQHYNRGVDWYLAHFPTITDRPDFLTGEATPNYLRFPKVAERIKVTFPQTKIILLLRNPVDRAISWHYHKLRTGLTKLNLATAISQEIDRLTTVTEAEIINTGFYNPDNILSSLYIYKIKPWMEILGREQFLILKSEDFYLDPSANMERVFKFLDLPSYSLKKYPKVNAGSYDNADPQLRKILAEYFAPYNQQLEAYLGLKFGWE